MNDKLLTIMLTDACNGDCTYCYQKINEKKMGALADEYINAIERILSEFGAIHFFGGEPLLEEQFIFKLDKRIDELIKSKRLKTKPVYIFSTNLVCLSDTFKNFLMKLKMEKNNPDFIITVDGDQEIHDKNRLLKNGKSSYKSIINNYQYLIDNGLNVETIYVVYNQQHLLKGISLSECAISISRAFPQVKYVMFNFEKLFESTKISDEKIEELRYGLLKDIFEDVVSGKEEFIGCRPFLCQELVGIHWSIRDDKEISVKCLMDRKKLSITPDGNVYMCVDQYYEGLKAITNLNDTKDLLEIYSNYSLPNNIKPEKCQKCEFKRICRLCPLKKEILDSECQQKYKYNNMIIFYLKIIFSDKKILSHFVQYSQLPNTLLFSIYKYLTTDLK